MTLKDNKTETKTSLNLKTSIKESETSFHPEYPLPIAHVTCLKTVMLHKLWGGCPAILHVHNREICRVRVRKHSMISFFGGVGGF